MVKARSMEFIRDRATLVWSLAFPLLMVGGLALAFNNQGEKVFKVGITGSSDLGLVSVLPELDLISYSQENQQDLLPEKKLRNHQIDALLLPDEQTLVFNPQSAKSRMALKILAAQLPGFVTREAAGKAVRYVDWAVPGIIAMNMAFSTLFGVGFVLVRYRKNGVLKRLKATPVSALNFLTAQAVSRLLIVLATGTAVFLAANLILGFTMNGSWLDLLLLFVLGITAMISLGLVLASRMKSEEVSNGVLNLLVFPMMLLSEVFFSLEGAPEWIRQTAQFLPLTPLIDGARKIMLEGAGLLDLLPQVGILGALAVICTLAAARLFRWD